MLKEVIYVVASSGAVDVAAMIDPTNDNFSTFVVNGVKNSIASAPSAPRADELIAQFTADPAWLFKQRTRYEVDDGRCDGLRQFFRNGSRRRPSNDQLVRFTFAHVRAGRNARTASIPRTTSPRATAASAALNARTPAVSESTSKVSSRLARSSVLMSTIAGRPFLVTVTRS